MKPTFNTPGCFLIYITTPCNFFTTVRFVKRHFYFSFIQENNKDGNWIKKSFIWSLHLKAWKGLGRINGGLRQGREINEFCMWVFNYSLFFLGCLRKIHFRIYCDEPLYPSFLKAYSTPTASVLSFWHLQNCTARFCQERKLGKKTLIFSLLHLQFSKEKVLDFYNRLSKHSVWKSPKMSHLKFSILTFSTNFLPIKTYLSGNSVWPQALGFQNSPNWTIFVTFN